MTTWCAGTGRSPRPNHSLLHAELVTAEVAHELAIARRALRATPPIPASLADPQPSTNVHPIERAGR